MKTLLVLSFSALPVFSAFAQVSSQAQFLNVEILQRETATSPTSTEVTVPGSLLANYGPLNPSESSQEFLSRGQVPIKNSAGGTLSRLIVKSRTGGELLVALCNTMQLGAMINQLAQIQSRMPDGSGPVRSLTLRVVLTRDGSRPIESHFNDSELGCSVPSRR